MIYEERLLLFADILGWSVANTNKSPDLLLDVITELHGLAEANSGARNAQMEGAIGTLVDTEMGPRKLVSPNPMRFHVQYGAFSDNIVISMPSSFGARIADHVSRLIRTLLSKGFLLRGAITIGDLYHKDSAVFGVPLGEAVSLEKKTNYPRVVINEQAFCKIKEIGYDSNDNSIVKDQCGEYVVNPFSIPIGLPEDVINSLIENNFRFREIKPAISNQINDLRAAGCYAQEAKWQYMRDFIEKCVLPTNVLLDSAWHGA